MVEMKILKDRNEWLRNRMKYIGGSDASAVIGLNPWKTNVQLWMEKTGQVIAQDISENPNVKFGTEAERHIREIFKLNYPKYEVQYEENNSWLNDKFRFAAASLDGWLIEKDTGRHGIWECKTSEIVSSMHKEKLDNQIPMNYYCQLLHYLMIREDCEFAHLTALLTWKFSDQEIYQQLRNYHIERSEVQEDIDYLENAERQFWQNVQTGKEPAIILPEL